LAKFLSANHQLDLILSYDNSSQERGKQVSKIILGERAQLVGEFLSSGYLRAEFCWTLTLYTQLIEHVGVRLEEAG
jgi:hypothetical protein